jgi:hypothetical protein
MKKKNRKSSKPPSTVDPAYREALEREAEFMKGWLDDIFSRWGETAEEATPHRDNNVIPFPKAKK